MLLLKVLVVKLLPVDTLASSTIAIGEVTALKHELFYHPMKYRAYHSRLRSKGADIHNAACFTFIVQRLA